MTDTAWVTSNFTKNISNYKIKKVTYKNGVTKYQPWGKLKYHPCRWKQLTQCYYDSFGSYKLEFDTYDEALSIIKKYINENNKFDQKIESSQDFNL